MPARKSWLHRHERFLLGAGTLVLVLAAWEIASRTGAVDPDFASRPSRIAAATIQEIAQGELWDNAQVTLLEFAVGFALAVAVGLPLGLIAGWSRFAGRVIDPFLMAFSSTPRSALIPILIVWFGLGLTSKAALVFLSGVIPLAVNTMTGVRTADPKLVQAARSFGANARQLGFLVLLPCAMPQIFAGLRLSLNLALIAVIVAEMYVSIAGIGRMIVIYGGVMRVDELFSYIIVISGFGCLMVLALSLIERIAMPWR